QPWSFRCGRKKVSDRPSRMEATLNIILGLRVMGKEPGRHVFFQVDEASVLLAFLAEATLKGDQLPPHGATGPGHFALGIEAEAFDAWRRLLHGHGVTIEKEVEWPRGGKSLYFRDPAGTRWNWSRLACGVCRAGGERCRISSAVPTAAY